MEKINHILYICDHVSECDRPDDCDHGIPHSIRSTYGNCSRNFTPCEGIEVNRMPDDWDTEEQGDYEPEDGWVMVRCIIYEED